MSFLNILLKSSYLYISPSLPPIFLLVDTQSSSLFAQYACFSVCSYFVYRVSSVSEAKVVTPDAYILFYELAETTTSRLWQEQFFISRLIGFWSILIGTAMQFRRHFNEFVQSTVLRHLSSLSAEQDRLCISEIVFENHVRLRFNMRQSNSNGYSQPLFTQGIIVSFEPKQGTSWAQARDILSQNLYNIIQK